MRPSTYPWRAARSDPSASLVDCRAASLISAISCSTDVVASRGYALELFGALSLQTLRVAITTAPVVPSTKTPTPLLPTPQHLPVVHIRRDAPTRSPPKETPAVGRLETVTFRPNIPETPFTTVTPGSILFSARFR